MNFFYKILRNLYCAVLSAVEHDAIEHAGYMAFMIFLSIFPFTIFILTITNFIGANELRAQFTEILISSMPESSADLSNAINGLISSPPRSLLTLAILGNIWTSSSFVECLRTILNRVYNITSLPNYFFRRLLSIVQFFLISLFIIATILVVVLIPIIVKKIPDIQILIGHYHDLLVYTRYIFLFLFLFLSICGSYYIIPNTKLNFLEVVPGAVLTLFLWFFSARLLSRYIIYYNKLSLIYGSLASIIITLIFFQVVNFFYILGAEFNYLMVKRAKSRAD
ncbi:YihY/virulence factor BrkB family protein [Rickettsia endosymbiont of Cardiosporidium cionae]|uniref:YihY/virulence factor BrkB family protein n=1 Tax=Rickettsia endosymbiont of Cardiosporidium cionae TaxID=2777155 RepID=UPI001895F75F|nr:YihY/virulence factor BrkB family protein [Rickettsia endosymbiont of Cardiosporidium cionae]KAF8818111.1 YihY/virulence factor BrkB family protein [Rickettsia endosymbiont of Cardiosporidium cionae]